MSYDDLAREMLDIMDGQIEQDRMMSRHAEEDAHHVTVFLGLVLMAIVVSVVAWGVWG